MIVVAEIISRWRKVFSEQLYSLSECWTFVRRGEVVHAS